jgi:hypothetical protein
MQKLLSRTTLGGALGLVAILLFAPLLQAQVVTSEIRGTVIDQNGQPIAGAQVSVTDTRTNVTRGALTNENGRYFVAQLQPGGPFTVRVQIIGYGPQGRTGINITLSQAETVNFQLQQTAVQVEELTVAVVGDDAVFSAGKTGQSTTIGQGEIETFPTITRSLMDLTLLSPYANQFENAPSIAGKANRLNNIQIDGAVNNDVFGVGESGTPGGQGNAKPITLEAIEEFQILVAPFDVRHSNFSGGLVNAVTKAGTNNWEFSGFGTFTNEAFVSDLTDSSGDPLEFGEFNDTQFGGTLGGPLVRDKVFFFGAFEAQIFDNPFQGFEAGVGNDFSDGLGIDAADASAIADVFQNTYGIDPGTTGALSVKNPRTNAFGRLDFQLGENNRLVVRHNYSRARNELSCNRGGFGEYCFTSNLAPFLTITNSTVAQLFTQLSDRWENEVLLNLEFINDERDPAVPYGQVTVEAPSFDFLVGAERFSQANSLDQTIFQFTDNLTGRFGDHRITFGTHNEFYSFENLFEPGLLGLWTFDSIGDLQSNTPSRYVKRVPAPGVEEADLPAKFDVFQLAFYAQDEWTVNDNLTLNFGLRAEIPILPDDPRLNSEFANAFGFSNTIVPSGNILWQPRFGFNYQTGEEYRTQFRGGVGLFAGRSPFVWISNAYGNTGIQSVDLSCSGSDAPGFNPDGPAPTTCVGGGGAGGAAQPIINVVDENFKFPLDLKFSAGIDRELPGGFDVTVEVLYSKAIEEVFFEDINLVESTGVDPVEGRPYFGTPTASGCGSRGGCFDNNLADDDFRNVVNLTNRSDSEALLLTFELQRQFSDWLRFRSSYTWANVQDLQVQQSSQATSNFGRNPIRGDPNNPEKADSNYEVENKIVLAATAQWDWGEKAYFQISPTYFGQSGLPYSYVVRGDPNGDNYRNPVISRDNDLIYIPSSISELAFTSPEEAADYDALINSDECLSSQRGSLMRRNSCRNPWNSSLDINFVVGIPTPGRGQLEVYGVLLNLLESELFQSRVDRGIEVLRVTGREGDADNGRFVYDYRGPQADSSGNIDPFSTFSPQSNRRLQIGARFRF